MEMKMENRKSEIESLPTSFVATLATIISYYRQRNIDPGVITHFEKRVETERERYKTKFENLRADPGCAGLADLINDIERQVDQIADIELSRARADGKVEHDHLSIALRDAQRGLSDAVNKVERK